jgi:hypothetical protein
MSRRILSLATWLVATATSAVALGGATLSFNASAPAITPDDQYIFSDDATIPGGTTPGGGTYNSQAYTDNVGPLGQTFTTPGTGFGYKVNAISVKSVGDAGGGVFTAPNTFSLRISSVSGVNLTPLTTVLAIPTVAGNSTTAIGWLTFSLSGADAVSLAPNTPYAFDLYSSNGWFGVDATQNDLEYVGGTAFNSAGPGRSFTDATLGNLATHGYDRTFHVDLQAVPEPVAGLLAACGLAGLFATRRRR